MSHPKRRILIKLSGGRCALCNEPVLLSNIGETAHILSPKEVGPRSCFDNSTIETEKKSGVRLDY
jgi:hypothetical protein